MMLAPLLLSLSLAIAPVLAPAPSPAPAHPAAPAPALALAAAPVADLSAAVAAYRDGHYAESATLFAELARAESDEQRAAVLHSNAGTAAARAQLWGEAAWQLRRALDLAPRDAVAAGNLARLREQIGETETEAEQFTATLLGLPLHLTPHENAWVAAAAAGLALLLLALWRSGRAGARAAWSAALLLVAALAWWQLASTAWSRERSRAVVIEPVVTGRAEPDAGADILFRLSQGTTVRHDEERHGWRLIETAAGARGWVPAAEVRPLGQS